jgi:hypothetical protein
MAGIVLYMVAPATVMAQSQLEKIKQAEAQLEKTRRERVENQARQDSIKAQNAQEQAVYDAQNKGTQGFLWLIIVAGVSVFAVIFYRKNKSTALSILRIFTGGFRTKGDVGTLESKKILAGALYAFQQGAYLNTLKADIGDKLHTILGEWWSINGRDTAIETLDYLRDKGFAYYFPTVWKASQAGSDEAIKALITEAMSTQEDADKAYSQTYNLMESIDKLKKMKIITHAADIEKTGVEGWDAGRLIFIARLCCDAQYITEDEAWKYIDHAYAQAQRAFQSWTEIAHSYIIGRCLWNGADANDGMALLAEDLINKPKSPWRQVAWK